MTKELAALECDISTFSRMILVRSFLNLQETRTCIIFDELKFRSDRTTDLSYFQDREHALKREFRSDPTTEYGVKCP